MYLYVNIAFKVLPLLFVRLVRPNTINVNYILVSFSSRPMSTVPLREQHFASDFYYNKEITERKRFPHLP